jgi:uncharacterized membrane protein YphA (DoxX/SURF4 family)
VTTETTTIRPANPLTVLLTSGWFIFLVRVGLGAMFLFSAIHKIQNPDAFAIAIRGYNLMPLALTNIFALAVAWSEAVAGIMLVLGVMTKHAAGAAFLLLAMFTIAITTTIVRGMTVDCGCFSNEGGDQTGYTLILRNLFLIVGAVMVMRFDNGFLSLSKALPKRR